MIPAFLTNQLARKILQTGKAVNFIRRCCLMPEWTLNQANYAPFDSINALDATQLNQWVEDACVKTN